MKKLYRSRRHKMIGGVCGGVANFFGIDPTIVRVLYTILALFTYVFPCVVLYIILLFVIPFNDSEDYIDV